MFENVTAKWAFTAQHFHYKNTECDHCLFLFSSFLPFLLCGHLSRAILYLLTRLSHNLFPLANVRPKGLPVNK